MGALLIWCCFANVVSMATEQHGLRSMIISLLDTENTSVNSESWDLNFDFSHPNAAGVKVQFLFSKDS